MWRFCGRRVVKSGDHMAAIWSPLGHGFVNSSNGFGSSSIGFVMLGIAPPPVPQVAVLCTTPTPAPRCTQRAYQQDGREQDDQNYVHAVAPFCEKDLPV